MIHPRNIIISPIITEKSEKLARDNNMYTFKVSINANKIEIKKAIEKIFSVKVLDVNTIRMLGKPKSLGKYNGKRPDWKKAVVTLREGDKIADFEV
ncbi:MAG TPA: 50S ribosomal protein L23 [Candidatus Syntrophosphaera thermopropionivorans]|jgi:large subunit ribosomal protein L23|uniref:50S ribosomal protein L23 n=1 Tax=Candidatus Syntrophosphaera thermopropionivorans TaxID=2593015 RepID=A0AC61QI24_9BACT|nr:50S ribosomal protein L23 [Candidatus Syntrophosphaera thermopropionivorans]MBP9006320.1 50S ribosomal protein L23 [Candidatus Syntrophosphaera sp.]NLA44335.1 50S ribosomal protein L23 [Candidatus Cloacimonadota bacterium]TDF72624.1 50S ribosomal protein L23 [Candidatus Syntrophosphaera thermopropionivorans]HNU97207.1 50S ribosomal protein L23 [Candidatus Syntrophosphaera thermopropionivorans]HOH82908.1 50S ribosomal protein L23 [Candidatus Syntrophosphaera thermopropionivorans]